MIFSYPEYADCMSVRILFCLSDLCFKMGLEGLGFYFFNKARKIIDKNVKGLMRNE